MRWVGSGFARKALCTVPALVCLVCCFIAVPLQMILPSLPVIVAKPDLPSLLVAYVAFRLPLIPSFSLAAAAGFWRDLLTAGHIGPDLLAFTLAAILVFLLRQALFLRSIRFLPPLAALATFVILGSSHTIRLLELGVWRWIAASWGEFVIASVLTALISLPIGWFFDWSLGLLLSRASIEKEDDLVEIELL
ncbi:hypothetical protein [Methylacidimicrobium sp. B4]|uniref:hypothetical protein n=1 Tax=Methylacidimicrobium sp. B4 TaxID=2796139 RepID=UPI001A90C879|nr:hypothetical protein [Methylacidimicrobium sp. B4]QSR85542.1 hypothetical protein MacB4_04770 [Methylacidimicrobium sp. B4]